MRKFLLCFSISLLLIQLSPVLAVTPGLYVGAGAGVGEVDSTDDDFSKLQPDKFPHIAHDSGAISGRFYGGYNFNQYIGLEAGFTTYPVLRYKAAFGPTMASFSDNESAIDLIGKMYLPFGNGKLAIYGLTGIAQVLQEAKYQYSKNLPIPISKSDHASTWHLRPKFGGGISYDITPHVTTTLEFSHIQGNGDPHYNAKSVPSANMLAVNLSYNF